MKTPKLYWVILIVSVTLAAQAQAGGHGGGGAGQIGFTGGGGGHTSSPAHVAAPSFSSAPRANLGGGPFVAPGQRFSSFGMRSAPVLRSQRLVDSNNVSRLRAPSADINYRGERTASRAIRSTVHSGADARNHIFARHTGDWHRDWDRHHDHWWHGHRCHFVNGYWLIFNTGFYPYNYSYPFGYPYDYYGYDYYPPDYYADNYTDAGPNYYDGAAYSSSDQSADPTIGGVQAQLAKRHYYRGGVDGIFGRQTRHAIVRFQRDQGLRATGKLTPETLHALGLQQVARN